MTQERSFEDYMNAARDSVPEPKELPNGNYRFRVRATKPFSPNEEKNTSGGINVALEAVMAYDNVDQDALKDVNFAESPIYRRFYIGTNADFHAFMKFVDLLGFTGAGGRALKEFVGELKGLQIDGQVSRQKSKKEGDGRIFVEVGNWQRVTD